MNTLLIVGISIAVILLWLIGSFNGLVTLRNRAKEAWSDIEVQLKRRYDLIPNLVNTVKGYASHESATFEKVTEARTSAMAAGTPAARNDAENALSGTLKTLFAVSEAYPELKANTNFLELQRELSDTENKIQSSRRFYNGQVRDLNTKMERFPTNMFTSMLGFTKMDFFGLGDEAAAATKPVEVQF